MESTTHQLRENGFAIVQQAISESDLCHVEADLNAGQAGRRNLLRLHAVRELAASTAVRQYIEAVLGPEPFAVRAILFNKLPGANWKVSWHQDCVVAVRERKDVPGWGPWSAKEGVTHVRPPADILSRMLAVRIHLDDCGEDNGPLRVIPGSHTEGLLSDEQIVGWPKVNAVTCTVQRGDIVLMRPLLLHASSAATTPINRRVIHIEFASEELPSGMEWHERVTGGTGHWAKASRL